MSATSPWTCFATTTPGLEPLLAGEVRGLGLSPDTVEPGGVEFAADPAQLVDALLWLRTAHRVTVRLATFRARTFGELERHVDGIDWLGVVVPGIAVHFRVTSKKSRLYHHDAIAERLERAVMPAVPGTNAVRGPAEAEALEHEVTRQPEIQRIVVRIMRDQVTLSADASGALLYFRGYRQAVGRAPLRETLAAALLLASGWTADLPLVDPMCGSGTIAIEAALMARRIAPGRLRRFAAERWPGFAAAFAPGRSRATAVERPAVVAAISASDRDAGAIAAARSNAERAGVAADVTCTQAAISHLPPDSGAGWVITNPPYGSRIGERTALRDLYATLGQLMRQRVPRWGLAMLSGDRMLVAQTGLVWRDLFATTNGGLPVRALATGPDPDASSAADP